jgi:outer membrane protein OmpA-like peptidoglycan-associated protein
MQKNQYLPMILIVAAILSGCGSMPKNSLLSATHNSYNTAQANPDVTSLAAVELKDAGDSLSKADAAWSKGESTIAVNQLAYIAQQKIAIAEETAKRKSAEAAVTDAGANRDRMRLEARTAEADAAKQEADAAKQQAMTAQQMADQQAAQLAAANAEALAAVNAEAQHNQSRLQETTAEAEAAKQQAAEARDMAAQKSAELAAANAHSEHDQALIAQQEAQLTELNAKKTERGTVITLGDVLFGAGQAKLKSRGMRSVQKLADFLEQYPQRKVLIEGYTDSTGSTRLNQELSERRANAVRSALSDAGVSRDRIMTRGYGKAFPVADNNTAANRQLNRRVEIVLSDDNGNLPDAR